MSRIDAYLDRAGDDMGGRSGAPAPDPQVAQGERLRRAHRTAAIVAGVALFFFLLSFVQILWLKYR
jgi:hypothetical protein